MLKKILIALAAVLVVLVAVIATRPPTFSVSRSRTVAAAPSALYAQVADFHRWAAWSPWEHLDPAMQKTFDGAGAGATYAWKGNKQVGAGRMTITGMKPDAEVDIRLEFLEPFASTSETKFTFAPQAAGTLVTWTMSGHNNFMAKAFSMVMDMDKLIGGDFERGLASLDAVAAKAPEPAVAR